MCEGGRVVHHLQHALGDARNTVLFVGYQGEGTLGRRLREGADTVNVLRRAGARARRDRGPRRLQRARRPGARLLDWVATLSRSRAPSSSCTASSAPAETLAGLLRERTGATVHVPQTGPGVRPVDMSEPRYQMGQRLHHPVFGEGLIVEVHTDRGREVLEVVFDGQLRRLSAAREWDDRGRRGAFDPRRAGGRGRGRGRRRRRRRRRAVTSSAQPLAPAGRPAAGALAAQRGASRSRTSTCAPQAEEWAGWASADRLLSLDSLRGVERFPHQVAACLRVLRDFGGRGILADEVGLGKTIEAGIVLKEYLLRGAVRTVLVLVPASLCEQWRAELWEKFELDFVVSRGPAGQWGRHPLVISSLETARHERHRRRVRGANYDMVVVRRGAPAAQPPHAGLEVHQRPEPALPAAAHRDAGAERPARALQPGHARAPGHRGHVLAVPPRLPVGSRQAHAAQHAAAAAPAARA